MTELGIALALLTAFIFGISISLQKHSLTKLELFTVKGMLSHKVWLLALLVGLAGVFVYILAMNYAPLSTVQPVMALSMVVPMIAGVLFFNEKLGVRKWLLVLLVIAGIALVTLF